MSTSRRTFMRQGAALGAAALAAAATGGAALAAPDGAEYAMIVDLNRCTGCGACTAACKLQNGTEQGTFLTRVVEGETGTGTSARATFLPVLCNQCKDAPCQPVCPTKAVFTLDSGIVATDWDKCVGDGACVSACPYGARFIDTRHGKADKCDFCLHRLAQGLKPACVENCPPGARVFGNLKAPEGEFARLLAKGKPAPLKPELGLSTHVLYVKRS